jgi:peptidyl-prolyl cis-trans isomerase B (cyclophilin B)
VFGQDRGGGRVAGKDREKELARQKFERQQARRAAEEAAARRNKALGGVAAAVVGVAAIGGLIFALKSDDKKDPKAAAATSPSASVSATPTATAKAGECLYSAAAGEKAAKDVGKPPVKPAYSGAVEATLDTSVGEVTFELDGKKAPCTTNAIAYLAKKGYFDKTSCHRLTTNVLQCGDPSGTGSGGPGFQYDNENTEGAKYKKGVLAMANAGAGTNGSQFFIVYKDWDDLPADYTVFGKVTAGLDKIESVGKAGSEPAGDGKPKKKVEINSVTIAKK